MVLLNSRFWNVLAKHVNPGTKTANKTLIKTLTIDNILYVEMLFKPNMIHKMSYLVNNPKPIHLL